MKNIDVSKLKTDEKEDLISLFEKNENYNSIFTEDEKQKLFFYRQKNIFYGKVDTYNNFIMLKNNYITDLPNNKNGAVACDIVSQAFVDMLTYYKKAQSIIPKSFYSNLVPISSFQTINDSYVEYLSNYFSSLTDYLSKSDLNKIKNPKDFFEIFKIAAAFFINKQRLPLTRTGFIGTTYCSPNTTGLIINLAKNTDNNRKTYTDYLSDLNFAFFVETAKKFNFMVDREKPWRLIFNLFDEEALLRGTPIRDCEITLPDGTVYSPPDSIILRPMGYFKMFNISSVQDFFEKRYDKSMIGTDYDETTEFESLKTVFIQMYNNICIPNEYAIFGKATKNKSIKIVSIKREPLYINSFKDNFSNELWLKFLFYLRALESRQMWNQTEFDDNVEKMLVLYKNYGIRNACNYINYMTRNILDVDKTSNRVVDRKNVINREFSEPEGFIFR